MKKIWHMGFGLSIANLLTLKHFSKIPYVLEDIQSSLRPIYINYLDLYLTVKFESTYFFVTAMVWIKI